MEITGSMQQSMFAMESSRNAQASLAQTRLMHVEQSSSSRNVVRPGESSFARMLEADPLQDAKLKESCIQLEGLLLKQMLNAMRKSVEKTGFIDGGRAEEIFTDMLYDKYAEEMSRAKTLGLSRTIYEQLTGGKKWV
jgi:flagellar protein FlgJ